MPHGDLCFEHTWLGAGGGRLSRCAVCGLVATAHEPSFVYEAQYFTDGASGGYDFDAEMARDFDADRFGHELTRLEHRGLRGTLLDVGCATGNYLCAAAARGWSVTGVEVAGFARDEARRRSGAPVAAACEDLPAGRTFDVVTLHHVLEHLRNPHEVLRQSIRPRVGRLLLIEVPNFDSLCSRVYGSRWQDLRLEQHVCHYTRETLAQVVTAAGFRVVRVYTLWEALWSLRSVQELGALVLKGARGTDRRWEAAMHDPSSVAGPRRPYRRATGARRMLTRVSQSLCRPLVTALEHRGLGSRLVVEATPEQVG